jgi:hypothetical protein
VEEKGLASVVRACREAGLDGAALCGVPNVDALRDVYMIEEWGVRTRLMEKVRTYRQAAEQQGAPPGTDGGAAAAAEGSRRSRAAELTFARGYRRGIVQALLHRTPTTSPPWPVRCLCFSRTVGTSRQLNARAWCPD